MMCLGVMTASHWDGIQMNSAGQLNRDGGRRGFLLSAVMTAVWLGLVSSTFAFQLPDEPPPISKPPPEGLQPPSDRDAESWLKKARRAAGRGDWKLAVDTLVRLIEDYGDRTVSLDGGEHFYSARRLGLDQLATWPPEGLAVYRLLYDAEAAHRFNEARTTYDIDALRGIVRQYPLTTSGPDAADLLASLLLDLHQPEEALDILARLADLPHAAAESRRIPERRAIALAMLGDNTGATHALQAARTEQQANAPDSPQSAARRERLDRIEAYVDAMRTSAARRENESLRPVWPQSLGPITAAGQMGAIDPAPSDDSQCVDVLPGAEGIDEAFLLELIRRSGRYPVWQAASDGDMLFVACPAGLMARDLATFDFAWQAVGKLRPRDPRIIAHRISVGMEDPPGAGSVDAVTHRTLCHDYVGAVATAFGLVFVIEQAETPSEQRLTRQGVFPPNDRAGDEDYPPSNSIRAYEAASGRAVWTVGRGGEPGAALRDAHFYAPPVACGERLIAPYQFGSEFSLAVLKPDGSLVKTVPIAAGDPKQLPMNAALQPAAAGSVVYIPTGAGLLVALSSFDFSLNWVARYDRVDLSHLVPSRKTVSGTYLPRYPQADGWSSTPPLVVGDLVVHTPIDADSLMAFDRRSGVAQWTHPRGDHRCVFAANHDFVFVAGRGVDAIRLTTGEIAWSIEEPSICGRPALCGEHVIVPVAAGLMRLEAATGQRIGELLGTESPPGNLLALAGGLYGISGRTIQMFPDVKKSKASAEAALAKNPDDAGALLRLAVLAARQETYANALTLLDRAQAAANRTAGTVETERESMDLKLSHWRTRALVGMAERQGATDRAFLLKRALESATSKTDKISAGLKLLDLYEEADNQDAAATLLLRLLREAGDEPIQVDPTFVVRAEVPLMARRDGFDPSNLAKPAESLACPAEVRIADAVGATELGVTLDMQLGETAMHDRRFEDGCFYFERAARRAPSAQKKAASLLRLAEAYLEPGEGLPPLTRNAVRAMDRLDALDDLPLTQIDSSRVTRKTTIREAVSRLRQEHGLDADDAATALPDILRDEEPLRLLRDEETTPSGGTPAAAYDDASTPGSIRGTPFVRVTNQIKSLRVDREPPDDVWWANVLLDPYESDNGPERDFYTRPVLPMASTCGVSVFLSGDRLYGMGTATGRMMWPPLEISLHEGAPPDPPAVGVDGMFVMAADARTLVAIRARIGESPLWRRRFPDMQLGKTAVVDDALLAVDRAGAQALLIAPETGAILRTLNIAPDASETFAAAASGGVDDAHIAIVGGTLCRSGFKSIAAWNVRSGDQQWRLELDGRVKSLTVLDDAHLGVCFRSNHYAVVNLGDGAIAKRIVLDDIAAPPLHATLDAGEAAGAARLLLFCTTDEETPRYLLRSIPLNGAERSWDRQLGKYAIVNHGMMRRSSRFVSIVRHEEASLIKGGPLGDQLVLSRPMLLFIDKQSGDRIGGRPYLFDEGLLAENHRSRRIDDVLVLDRYVVAVAPEGYFVLSKAFGRRRVVEASSDRERREGGVR